MTHTASQAGVYDPNMALGIYIDLALVPAFFVSQVCLLGADLTPGRLAWGRCVWLGSTHKHASVWGKGHHGMRVCVLLVLGLASLWQMGSTRSLRLFLLGSVCKLNSPYTIRALQLCPFSSYPSFHHLPFSSTTRQA